MNEKQKNIAASIRQRLFNYAKENGLDFNLLLIRFANERLLYRLSISEHKNKFLLKGATLFTIWFDAPHRPTKDIDLLGFGSNEIVDLEKVFTEICRIEVEDGLLFDLENLKGIEIKEGEEYQGVRISSLAFLGKARINWQVDIGFGDAVTPEAKMIEMPTLLDLPAPELKIYPKETVVAEKFEAMVKLGILNSRMKDFWDLQVLVKEFEFESESLQEAILTTFERRKTKFPTDLPVALTEEFINDTGKQYQWKAFTEKNKFEDVSLDSVINLLKMFFKPLIGSVEQNRSLKAIWKKNKWLKK